MPSRVVDGSVIASWCFREARSSEAMRLLQDVDLYAPVILAYELASIARKKAVAYPGNAAALYVGLSEALTLPIHWSDVDHLAVLRLALDTGLTTYDASYLYLSHFMAVPLVTFDRQLWRAAREYL